eukprot:g4927.t1
MNELSNKLSSLSVESEAAETILNKVAAETAKSVKSRPVPFFVLSKLLCEAHKIKQRCRVDIDAENGQPKNMSCVEYVSDIFKSFRLAELSAAARVSNEYVNERSTRATVRVAVIDWVMDIHNSYDMGSETIFLAVSIFDRFASRHTLDLNQYPLLGLCCLHIAAKYEEIYFPSQKELVEILAEQNSAGKKKRFGSHHEYMISLLDDFKKMEGLILNVVSFELTFPTPLTFLARFLRANEAPAFVSRTRKVKKKENVPDVSNRNKQRRSSKTAAKKCRDMFKKKGSKSSEDRLSRLDMIEPLAKYFCELTLTDPGMLAYLPSEIAAASVMAARSVSGVHKWTGTLVRYTGYSSKALQSCVADIRRLRLLAATETCDIPKSNDFLVALIDSGRSVRKRMKNLNTSLKSGGIDLHSKNVMASLR